MKNTLMVPLVFLSNLVVWTCLVAFFSVLSVPDSLRVLNEVRSGQFLLSLLFHAIRMFPFILMVVFLNVFIYLMRHRTILLISIPLVLLLAGASVVFLIPFSWRAGDAFSSAFPLYAGGADREPNTLYQDGIIRSSDGYRRSVWFNSSETRDAVAPLIVANTAIRPGLHVLQTFPVGRFVPSDGSLSAGTATVIEGAGGQIEPELVSGLESPFFIASFIDEVNAVLSGFRTSTVGGPLGRYCAVTCFFLAVLALSVLCFATGWRFLNLLLLLAGFRLVFAGYAWTVSGPAFSLVRKFLPASVPDGLISPAFYLALALVLALYGLCCLIGRKVGRKHSRGTYE
jgi:hypothetical protein